MVWDGASERMDEPSVLGRRLDKPTSIVKMCVSDTLGILYNLLTNYEQPFLPRPKWANAEYSSDRPNAVFVPRSLTGTLHPDAGACRPGGTSD